MRRIIPLGLVATASLFLASALATPSDADPKAKDTSKGQADRQSEPEKLTRGDIYKRVIHASGLVVVVTGKQRARTYGTCWVLSERNRWVVTNWHVVKGKGQVGVLFPSYKEGEAISSSRFYKDREAIPGKVVASSSELDLAIVQLTDLPATARKLRLADEEPRPGQTVFSVGNAGRSKDNLWRFRELEIVRVRREVTKRPDGTLFKAQVIESKRNSNPGDSGGPVVDEGARVVGIHRAGGKMSISVHVQELRAFVKRTLLRDSASGESVLN